MKKFDKLDDCMAQLKTAAQLIDDADTPLEKAIEAYQNGAEAYKACIAMLDNFEQQLQIINQSLQEEDGHDD